MEEKEGCGCIYGIIKLFVLLFVFDYYYDSSFVKLWSDISAHPIFSAFFILAWIFAIIYWVYNLLK